MDCLFHYQQQNDYNKNVRVCMHKILIDYYLDGEIYLHGIIFFMKKSV